MKLINTILITLLLTVAGWSQDYGANGVGEGFNISFMVPYAGISLDDGTTTIVNDVSALYIGGCYEWRDHTFFTGAGFYASPGITIDGGFELTSLDLAATFFIYRNFQAGFEWDAWERQNGELIRNEFGSENIRFIVDLELFSAIRNLFGGGEDEE